jgi:hypothetical protein
MTIKLWGDSGSAPAFKNLSVRQCVGNLKETTYGVKSKVSLKFMHNFFMTKLRKKKELTTVSTKVL